jgi:TM2 domain-containing membrane protein YozV
MEMKLHRRMLIAYLCWFFGGLLGLHRFLHGRKKSGLRMLAGFLCWFVALFAFSAHFKATMGTGHDMHLSTLVWIVAMIIAAASALWTLSDAFRLHRWVKEREQESALKRGLGLQ